MRNLDPLLVEQMAYYRARASEYDEWFLRQGRYDHGPAMNQQWFAEVEAVRQELERFRPAGRVLEMACGTGLWTQHLVRFADALTAVDTSPEMLALNCERLGQGRAQYIQADLFDWEPDARYDTVFFSFWLSHVPPDRFQDFWQKIRSCLAPDGRVFFIDSLFSESSTARDQRLGEHDATSMTRRLNDGREFRIVKVYYRPEDLAARLAQQGWQVEVHATAHYFLYGSGATAQIAYRNSGHSGSGG